MTVHNVQVVEGKPTVLNFTLAPVVDNSAGSTTMPTTSMPSTSVPHISTTTPHTSESTRVVSSDENKSSPPVLPPEPQPIQPQEFRHHNYADMELFLRKYNNEFPSITYLDKVGYSAKGLELFVMVISDNPTVHEHGMFSQVANRVNERWLIVFYVSCLCPFNCSV